MFFKRIVVFCALLAAGADYETRKKIPEESGTG